MFYLFTSIGETDGVEPGLGVGVGSQAFRPITKLRRMAAKMPTPLRLGFHCQDNTIPMSRNPMLDELANRG